jgi:hypothetical protein
MPRFSLLAFWLGAALILGTAFFFYPKWKQPATEATISWDVSGYYTYLPAVFIYGDLHQLTFLDTIMERYHPASSRYQAFAHPSGAQVLKYSAGQALQFLPWFAVGHALARPLGYPADGFSYPYQVAISWGSLLVALLGLWVARRNLLTYFSDTTTAWVLLALAFATNYLNYTAIDHAMTHNWLFTAYSLLVLATIGFYRRPTYAAAAAIGLLLGWMMLTRPTELVAVLIPLLWSARGWRERLGFFREQAGRLGLAMLCTIAVGFIQLAYWKFTAGEWLVYSYEDQGFNWLRPHVYYAALSYRAGWLVYTPIMTVAIFGLVALRRRREVWLAVLTFCLVSFYVLSAWNIWWYGGSLGQRAVVQYYALWIFPLAAAVEWLWQRPWSRVVWLVLLAAFTWHNLWWTRQAHDGDGLFHVEQMTRKFYWKVLGKDRLERDWLKLLDTNEEFRGAERRNVRELFASGFESDTAGVTTDRPIAGARSQFVDGAHPYTPASTIPGVDAGADWLRATITFQCDEKEWEYWRMTQFIVRFAQGEKVVKDRMIRLQRHVDGSEVKTVFFDVKVPKKPFDTVKVYCWNADGPKRVRLDDLKVEAFEQ